MSTCTAHVLHHYQLSVSWNYQDYRTPQLTGKAAILLHHTDSQSSPAPWTTCPAIKKHRCISQQFWEQDNAAYKLACAWRPLISHTISGSTREHVQKCSFLCLRLFFLSFMLDVWKILSSSICSILKGILFLTSSESSGT